MNGPERDETSGRRLYGMLAEFRTALEEEINAARKSAANLAVSLLNGRRIGLIGSSFQYAFEIENVLNLPGDAPGDLYVPGQPPLEVTVVSVEGLSITLSVATDLGQFVPEARLQSNLAQLMRKLIERIENLAEAENSVGERIRGTRLVSGEPVGHSTIDLRSFGAELNQQQLSAIAAAVGRNATFIWGPPGTGKSRTIGMIGAELFRRSRSVLLVSHTNNAVDQAIWHIAKIVGSAALARGLVIRVGESKDERVANEKELLLSTHVERRAEQLASRQALLQEILAERTAAVHEVNREIEICEWLNEVPKDIKWMEDSLAHLIDREEHLVV